MTKIDEAQQILRDLGLPPPQCNEIAALTLLVLAGIGEADTWAAASSNSLTIHLILAGIRSAFGRTYAENTRETVRRQVVHQFIQAAILEQNPDDPSLATNSPRTHYALTPELLASLTRYGTEDWDKAVGEFREAQPSLAERYAKNRERHNVPLKSDTGQDLLLSPGLHNTLQSQIITEFGPRFAQGATLCYLGDTAKKQVVVLSERLAKVGLDLTQHGKLPDVVLIDAVANLIYLIEAVTSHGPVSAKRQIELEALLSECELSRVYVSAFPDFTTFKRFAAEVAWETDVWIAENPSHLIHYNGGELQSNDLGSSSE